MYALISALMLPLMFLNIFGGIVSGIWLAILGEWGGLGAGLLVLFFGAFLAGLLILPSFLIGIPAILLVEKGGFFKIPGFIIGMFGLLWTTGVMSVWGIVSFQYFILGSVDSNFIPYVLWAYGVATGTWAYMASKEEDNSFASVHVLCLQIAAAFVVFCFLFTNLNILLIYGIYLCIMILGTIGSVAMGGISTLRRP